MISLNQLGEMRLLGGTARGRRRQGRGNNLQTSPADAAEFCLRRIIRTTIWTIHGGDYMSVHQMSDIEY